MTGLAPIPGSFDYSLFGLHLRSELALPELAPADPAMDAQIRIGLAPLEVPPRPGFEPYAIPGGVAFAVEGVARYAVIGGDTILVDPEAGSPRRNVRLYLLGSALGMLIQQRGMLPLHANAIEIAGRAFAFVGPSGAGKSTLAAWMHDRGHRAIADDVCVVSFDDCNRAVVNPGLPRLRLWKDALEGTGRTAVNFDQSYAGTESAEKFDVPLDLDKIAQREGDPVLLGGIYILDQGPDRSIVPIRGVKAFDAISSNIYRGGYLSLTDQQSRYWSTCTELARSVSVFTAIRRWGYASFDEEAGALLAHASALAGRQAGGIGVEA